MSRIQLDLETLAFAIDNGFTDTISILIDSFTFAGKCRRYENIPRYTQFGWIEKRTLIKPCAVKDLIQRILANDFEQGERTITRKIKGKKIYEKQVYYINTNFDGYAIFYNPRKYYFSIMCQHSAILGKAKAEIIQDIKNLFQYQFCVEDKYIHNLDRAIKLGRIDFKRDHRYKDEQHLALLKYIVEIAPETIVNCNYKKQDEKDEHPDIDNFDEIEYMKKFKSESNKTAEFVVYDKYLERLDKFKQGLITQEELEQYEKSIRFEVRIKANKLNSISANLNKIEEEKKQEDENKEEAKKAKKRKKKEKMAMEKDIDNYKNEKVADELFEDYSEKVFFKSDIFRIDYAIRKIYKCKERKATRRIMVKLIKLIHEKGYTKARDEFNKFDYYVKKFEENNINPLTFPSTWKDRGGNIHKTTYTSIPNPIKKENCILEDDYIIPSKYWELVKQKKKDTRAL